MSKEIKKEAQFKKLSLDALSKVSGGEKASDGRVCSYCGCDTYYHDHGDICVGCGRAFIPVKPS